MSNLRNLSQIRCMPLWALTTNIYFKRNVINFSGLIEEDIFHFMFCKDIIESVKNENRHFIGYP